LTKSRLCVRLSDKLGQKDVESARRKELKSIGQRNTLKKGFPKHVVTAMAQLRLNRNRVKCKRKWVNIGEFRSIDCKFCGDSLPLDHVLFACPHNIENRARFHREIKQAIPGPLYPVFETIQSLIGQSWHLAPLKILSGFTNACITSFFQ